MDVGSRNRWPTEVNKRAWIARALVTVATAATLVTSRLLVSVDAAKLLRDRKRTEKKPKGADTEKTNKCRQATKKRSRKATSRR